MEPWKWVQLDDHTARMRVPGGWIVRTVIITIDAAQLPQHTSIAQTFVPDAPPEGPVH